VSINSRFTTWLGRCHSRYRAGSCTRRLNSYRSYLTFISPHAVTFEGVDDIVDLFRRLVALELHRLIWLVRLSADAGKKHGRSLSGGRVSQIRGGLVVQPLTTESLPFRGQVTQHLQRCREWNVVR